MLYWGVKTVKLLSTTSNVVGVLEKDKLLPWPVLPITKNSNVNNELLSTKLSPCKLASLQGESLVDSSSLFTLEFFVIGSTGQGSSLSFSSTPTTLEVVDNSFTVLTPQYNNGYFSVSLH